MERVTGFVSTPDGERQVLMERVVRCGMCRHARAEGDPSAELLVCRLRPESGFSVYAGDFCSRGEAE